MSFALYPDNSLAESLLLQDLQCILISDVILKLDAYGRIAVAKLGPARVDLAELKVFRCISGDHGALRICADALSRNGKHRIGVSLQELGYGHLLYCEFLFLYR